MKTYINNILKMLNKEILRTGDTGTEGVKISLDLSQITDINLLTDELLKFDSIFYEIDGNEIIISVPNLDYMPYEIDINQKIKLEQK